MIEHEVINRVESTPVERQACADSLYHNGIRAYGLRPSMFLASEGRVFEAASNMYERGYFTFDSLTLPENDLHVLMVADAYASAKSEAERNSLLWVMKHAIDMSSSGAEQRKHSIGIDSQERGIQEHTAIEASVMVTKRCQRWGAGSVLNTVRHNLQVTEKREKSYRATVLTLRTNQFLDTYGGIGFADIDLHGRPRMVVPIDVDDATIEHEYAHTQSQSVKRGGRSKLLFRAINEAITESAIRRPEAYAASRILYNKLCADTRGLRVLLQRAYMGDEICFKEAEKRLVHAYGLKGLLLISTCAPDNDPEHMQKAYGENVPFFTDQADVLSYFNLQMPQGGKRESRVLFPTSFFIRK